MHLFDVLAGQAERAIASIDIEGTGVNPETDRIVQVGVSVLHPDMSRVKWSSLVNPGIPIPPEATEIHHITDEDVKDAPPFGEIARTLVLGLRGTSRRRSAPWIR